MSEAGRGPDRDGATQRVAPLPRLWWLIAVATVLAWGASAGPHLYDTGELTEAAWMLGGSHPPGQPLHALLAHLLCLLPLGPIPWRVALFSVMSAVAAAWMVGWLAAELLSLAAPEPCRSRAGRWTRRLTPDAAASAVLLAPCLSRQTTRVEVYALALALWAGAALALIRWARGGARSSAALRVGAFLAGLTVAAHPPHALGALLLGAVVLAVARRDALRKARTLAWAAGACAVGLLVHVYLPVRALAGAPMWGDPAAMAGFYDYVTAHAYAQNLGTGGGSLASHVWAVAGFIVVASGGVSVVGALLLARRAAGCVEGSRVALRAASLAIPVLGIAALVTPFDEHNPDTLAYAGPAVALLIAAAASGWAQLGGGRMATWFAAALLAVTALNVPALLRLPHPFDTDAPLLDTLADALWDTPPARALVVTQTDYVASTWMLGRSVYGARPDVAHFVSGLSTSSWHWRTLRAHPLFDGSPVAGRGRDAHERYTAGAIQLAVGRVPIASEADLPVGGNGAVAGPYLLLAAGGEPTVEARWTDAVGERLDGELDREAEDARRSGPAGALNVYRHLELERARRLLVRGLGGDAVRRIAHALASTPATDLPALSGMSGGLVRPIAPTVAEPGGFLATPEVTVRRAAALVFAMGHTAEAFGLLRGQVERGRPRGALQLAWLYASVGDRSAARHAVAGFRRAAPGLASEADELERGLR